MSNLDEGEFPDIGEAGKAPIVPPNGHAGNSAEPEARKTNGAGPQASGNLITD